jgi:hypothetical protein
MSRSTTLATSLLKALRWTTEIGGQLTVVHTATTMLWADAPSSVTATATATASMKDGSSTSGASVIGTGPRYMLLAIATDIIFGCF